MIIRQLSVFVENKIGGVSEILDILQRNNVNIEALSIAEADGYGIMRMITENARLAAEKLSCEGIIVKCTEVIAVPIDNNPGGLALIMNKLKENDISVDYLYAFVAKEEGTARVVIKTQDNAKAEKILDIR